MNTPFVSFIIPVYNKEKYIGRCLDSLLAQTCSDFEVVIVDDGSSDDSAAVISSFQDSRIRSYRQANAGVSAARNEGLLKACGQYVAFIDSDDYVSADYVETLFQMYSCYPETDLFIFGLQKCDKQGRDLGLFCPSVRGYQPWAEFYWTFMKEQGEKGVYGYVSTKLIRRSFIQKYHVVFDTSIRLAEDYNFYLDLFLLKPVLFFSDYCGYHYVQEVENSSCFQRNVDYFALIRIWIKTLHFLQGHEGFSNNLMLIEEKIRGLNAAMFYELSEVSYRNVHRLVDAVHELEGSLTVFRRQDTRLQRWIARKQYALIYLFLLLRKVSHIIRNIQ